MTETPMNLRYGNLGDAKMLSELGARTFYDAFAKDNTPENIALYLEKSFSPEIQWNELSAPDNIFLIAETESQPIGYAQLIIDSKDERLQEIKTLEIRRIYAIKEFIGKGVGRALIQATIQEAKQRGCASIWLGVWEKNPRAISFYKNWGFREVGTHIFHLGNDPQRDFILELPLG